MPSALIGGAVSGIGSLVGGILGHNAAEDAAKAQAAAGNKAANMATNAGLQAQGQQQQQFAAENANAQPFVGAGQGAATSLSSLLSPGGQLTKGYGDFQAPTGVTEQNDPGYQFRLQQGVNALQNSAAARGGLLSTGTAKNLTDYAQGEASQEYGNVYNRALATYGTNQNNFNTNNNNLFQRLYGVAGLGANSAANLNSVTQQGTNNFTNDLLSTAQLAGNDIMGVGNAQAAGIVGGANALNAGIGGAANALGSGISLQAILGAQNASNPTSGLSNGAMSG